MKKHLIFLTSVLACTTLASIGFATWIITGNSTKDVEDNDVIVDTVSDQRLSIDYEWTNGKSDNKKSTSFIFGWNGATNASDWLVDDDDSKKEKLEDTLNITISNATYLRDTAALEFTLAATGEQWETAVNEGYVVAPTLNSVNKSSITIGEGTGTYALNVKFGWGTKFGGENPYTYYNKQAFSDSLADEAKTNITQLNTYLTDVKFTLTVKAYAA